MRDMMLNAIQDYIRYLHNVKQVAHNTEISYERDLKKAAAFLEILDILRGKCLRLFDKCADCSFMLSNLLRDVVEYRLVLVGYRVHRFNFFLHQKSFSHVNVN